MLSFLVSSDILFQSVCDADTDKIAYSKNKANIELT